MKFEDIAMQINIKPFEKRGVYKKKENNNIYEVYKIQLL